MFAANDQPTNHPLNRRYAGQSALTLLVGRQEEQEMMGFWGWQWSQLDNMQTVCTSPQTDNQTNTSSLSFYRPDALPAA